METVLFGAFPALVGLTLAAGALRRIGGGREARPRAVGLVVLVLSATALWLLWRIFVARAWPTALPHVCLAVALVFVFLEHRLVERRPADTAE